MVSLALIWVKFEYGKLLFFSFDLQFSPLKIAVVFLLHTGKFYVTIYASQRCPFWSFFFSFFLFSFFPNWHLTFINQSSTIEIRCSVLFIVKYEVHSLVWRSPASMNYGAAFQSMSLWWLVCLLPFASCLPSSFWNTNKAWVCSLALAVISWHCSRRCNCITYFL